MQSFRHFNLLGQDEIVRHSPTWHECGGKTIRPEDVIVAAFVQLRRIAVRLLTLFLRPLTYSTSSDCDYGPHPFP
jgi:hypothetical protein